jgi:hypothetical protein
MLNRKKPVQLRTQPTRRPPLKFTRPVLAPFPEEEGAFASAQRLVEKYTKIVDGHRAVIRQFLQTCYPVVLKFQSEPDEFERLKVDPFWDASRQKPKDPSTSKWVLYFVMQAKTKNVRNRAGRYAVVVDGLIREKVRPDMVAARINEMHGVEAACAHFLAAELGQSEVIDADDDEMEDEALPIPQKGGQRAARGGNGTGSPRQSLPHDHRLSARCDGLRSCGPRTVSQEPSQQEAVAAAGETEDASGQAQA